MRREFGEEQYFEDFAAGDEFRTAAAHFDQDAIIAFARDYDPQPFHTDPEAAARSHYKGLIASGWQVGALTFRALIDAGFLRGGGMGSPGLDELRWKKPVRPGDTLVTVVRVAATRPSRTRADRGYVDFEVVAVNQHDEAVMSYRVTEIVKRRGI